MSRPSACRPTAIPRSPAGGSCCRRATTGTSSWSSTSRPASAGPCSDAAGADFAAPAVSADGRQVVAIRGEHDSYDQPGDVTLVVAPLDGADAEPEASSRPEGPRDLLPGFDRRPLSAAWAPDGESVYFTADDNGRRPVFAVSIATGAVTRVTSDDAAYESLCPSPDGRALYALRATISEPPTPVRIDLTQPGSEPVTAAGSRRAGGGARAGRGGLGHRGRRHHDQRLAGAPRRGVGATPGRRCCCGCTAAP